MCEDGFMSEGRRDALLRFPWHHDIIFHEAGIPPIHTPMATLQVMPDIKCPVLPNNLSPFALPGLTTQTILPNPARDERQLV